MQVVQSDKSGDTEYIAGPSGFMELGGNMLVVDFGKIFMEETVVGYLYEDGYLINSSGGEEEAQWRVIDDLEGCVFRGIDSRGLELVLPMSDKGGPSGTLFYNGLEFKVMHGRICTSEHALLGDIDDQGNISLRDHYTKTARRTMDATNLLSVYFEGEKSDGTPFMHEYYRPLYRKDKSYTENEIIRYFQDFDKLGVQQKKYVYDSMQIWATSGLLQVVRKSEGNAALGSVKHGAAGVTRVRTGMVDLDAEEFDRDIDLFKRFGALAVVATRYQPYVEVRVNLVVSHEFGHQLQFCLTENAVERIKELYDARNKRSTRMHLPPPGYDGNSELLRPEYVMSRMFISGYAKSSKEEYWAECVAAFSIPESRKILQEMDPAVCKLLTEVIYHPETMLALVFREQILDLQASLRAGGEFGEDLLNL